MINAGEAVANDGVEAPTWVMGVIVALKRYINSP